MDIPVRFGLYTGTCLICRALCPLLRRDPNTPIERRPTTPRVVEYVYKSSQNIHRFGVARQLAELQKRRLTLSIKDGERFIRERSERRNSSALDRPRLQDWDLVERPLTRVVVSPTVQIFLEWRWCEQDMMEEPILGGEPLCLSRRHSWSKRLLEAASQLFEKEARDVLDVEDQSSVVRTAVGSERACLDRKDVETLVMLLQRVRLRESHTECGVKEDQSCFSRRSSVLLEDEVVEPGDAITSTVVEMPKADLKLDLHESEEQDSDLPVSPEISEQLNVLPPSVFSLGIEKSTEKEEDEDKGEENLPQRTEKVPGDDIPDAETASLPEAPSVEISEPGVEEVGVENPSEKAPVLSFTEKQGEALRTGEIKSEIIDTAKLEAEHALDPIGEAPPGLDEEYGKSTQKMEQDSQKPYEDLLHSDRRPRPLSLPSTPRHHSSRQERSNSMHSHNSLSSVRTTDDVLDTMITSLSNPNTSERARPMHQLSPWWVDYTATAVVEEEQEGASPTPAVSEPAPHPRPYSSSSNRRWSSIIPRRLSSAHGHHEKPPTPNSNSTGTSPRPSSRYSTPRRPSSAYFSQERPSTPVSATSPVQNSPKTSPNKLHKKRPPVTPLLVPEGSPSAEVSPHRSRRSVSSSFGRVIKKVERKLGFGKEDEMEETVLVTDEKDSEHEEKMGHEHRRSASLFGRGSFRRSKRTISSIL